MLLFQCAVMIGVASLGFYLRWTPNGYLLGLIAWVAALLATYVVLKGQQLAARWRRQARLIGDDRAQ